MTEQTNSTGPTRPGRPAVGGGRALALVAAVGIVALAAVLRFEGLGSDSLAGNEPRSLQYAQWPLSHPQHWNNGMALFHAILHVWIRIAGESEAALRFPSAVFGVAAVVALLALVRRLNGWPTALAAALMLALSWRHVYYSQEARSYSLFIMLAIVTTLLLVRLLERPGTGRLVAYGIALVALAYSHYQWIFVLVFHDVVVLLSRRRVGWGWLVLHAAVAVAYVPQLVLGILPHAGWSPSYMPRHPSVLVGLGALHDFLSLLPHEPIRSALPAARDLNVLSLFVLPVVAAAGVVSCALPVLVRFWPKLRTALPSLTRCTAPEATGSAAPGLSWLPLVWFAGVFVLPFLIAHAGKPIFHWQYVAAALPAYCWFIGLAVAALPHWAPRVALMAVCVLLVVPALETSKARPMREDWRGCAQAIAAHARPGDQIVLWPDFAAGRFNVYHGGSPPTGLSPTLRTEAAITDALAWTEPPPRVWLVIAQDLAPSEPITAYFAHRPDYRLVRCYDREFAGITLLRFDHVETTASSQDD
jgi:mannosyltransferase